jgi:hypothetical protein
MPAGLRERVGRGVAPVSSTLRIRRLVVPSPPHPNPLQRGEREPEVPAAKSVITNSTVLLLTLCRDIVEKYEGLCVRHCYLDFELHGSLQRLIESPLHVCVRGFDKESLGRRCPRHGVA